VAREKPRMQNITKNNGIVFIFLLKRESDILYDMLCVCVKVLYFIIINAHHHTLLLFIEGT
jgi:hypothetical protein